MKAEKVGWPGACRTWDDSTRQLLLALLSHSPRYDHPSPTDSWGSRLSYEGSLMKKLLHTPVSSMGGVDVSE
jgi:hypothetical protein